jgi:hypothetical protein
VEVQEKLPLRVSFEAFKINTQVKLLARVRSKVDKKYQNTSGVEVNFYAEGISPEQFMGKDISNHKGEAFWMIPLSDEMDSLKVITYLAVVEGNPDYEDIEEEVSVQPSVVEMKLEIADSMRMVNVSVSAPDDSGMIGPLAGVECYVFVKRLFGMMPIGESDITDEEGEVSFEIPDNLPGDMEGIFTLVVKIKDHELIGNVEISQSIKWGIPVKANDFYTKRELWSARANSPIMLIVVVNAMIIGIWGAICFIFLEIFRIYKIGKESERYIP